MTPPERNNALCDAGAGAGNILVVDDEPFIRNAFELYLESHNFKVWTADCGEAALPIFREQPIDLVLLDLVMPGLQGLEVLRRLKAEDSLVEVIIATGCGSMHSAIEALRLGAFDFITKPIIDFDRDLLGVVQLAVQQRRDKLARIPSVASADSVADEYYQGLEEVAAKVFHAATRRAALSLLESFFRDHYGTSGGLVAEHSSGSISFVLGWGLFRDCDRLGYSPPDVSSAEFWRPLLKSTSHWERVAVGAPLPTVLMADDEEAGSTDATRTFEVWRVPLAPEHDAEAASTSLFVFRDEGGDAPPPPRTTLLSLVVSAALAKHTVAAAVS